jgi:predicted dehydrogenase
MTDRNSLNRRDFLKGVTLTSLGLALAMEELNAEAQPEQNNAEKPAPPVNCAVIGLGPQGREILTSLAKLPNGPVVAICDTYQEAAFLKRASDIAPKAAVAADYKQVLGINDVKAVFVATPSHLHKQIVLDALAAGKHVYCEAPLAVDLDEAKAIAQAGAAAKTVFQPGLQYRSNKMHNHVAKFLLDLGKVAEGRAQWHRRTSWRSPASKPEREKELNWRLSKATSLGLPGEVGIHTFDIASWYFKALPVSVTAFGGIYNWNDGRDVPDTVQCILEYPNGVRFVYDATLVNSFDGAYEVFMGEKCAILVRDQRGWMFKESDAEQLDWEVYAQKQVLGFGSFVDTKTQTMRLVEGTGTGIMLVADATKIMAAGNEPGKVGSDVTKTALYYAVSNFLNRCGGVGEKLPAATALDAYRANVVAARINEAISTGSKVTLQKEWFDL